MIAIKSEKAVRGLDYYPFRCGWKWVPVKGTSMKRFNLAYFYEIGGILHQLDMVNVHSDPYKVDMAISFCNMILDELLSHEFIKIDMSRERLIELQKRTKRWAQVGAQNFDDHSIQLIKDLLHSFEQFFSHDLQQLDVFLVEDRGIYNTRKLIEAASCALPHNILTLLPQKAKDDLNDGGRCLAFDLWTASGFHFLRSLETVIHDYYQKLKGQSLPKRLPSWGEYIKELKLVGASNRIISAIQQIKDEERNPLMHPEQNLIEPYAFILFDIVKSAIHAMYDDLKDRDLL